MWLNAIFDVVCSGFYGRFAVVWGGLGWFAVIRWSLFVRQSCGVVHNTMRLSYKTKKFAVADRCTAAAMLM